MNELGFKAKLDATVLDIEFLLISVIQGVALASLSGSAVGVIGMFQFEYWPYVATAFVFILTFWSGAIIHSLSFIDWPLDLGHNFLYFLASFVEVMAFNQMMSPLKWFEFVFIFFLVAAILYVYDFRLIKKHRQKLSKSPAGLRLYTDIYKEHLFEMGVLVPAGLAYNLVALVLLRLYPQTFLDQHYHIILITIQLIFGIVVLLNSIRSFKKRATLISLTDL